MNGPKRKRAKGGLDAFLRRNMVPLAAVAVIAAVVAISSDRQQASIGAAIPQPGSGGGALPPGSQPAAGMQTHSIVDKNGFGAPMEAAQILVPPGWQVTSEVRWDGVGGRCSATLATPIARLASPDGRESIEFLPGFFVSTWPDPMVARGLRPGDFCVLASAETGEALLRDVAMPMLRPRAAIDRVERLAVPASLTEMIERMRPTLPPGGRFEAYGVAATFRSGDGLAHEKMFLTGSVMALPPLIEGVRPMILNQNATSFVVRAPPERLAQVEALATTILSNLRPNPEWQRAVTERDRMSRAAVAKAGQTGPSSRPGSTRPSSPGGGFDMDEWRRGQARDDEAQRQRVETIRETQRCRDPETGATYEVSIHAGC